MEGDWSWVLMGWQLEISQECYPGTQHKFRAPASQTNSVLIFLHVCFLRFVFHLTFTLLCDTYKDFNFLFLQIFSNYAVILKVTSLHYFKMEFFFNQMRNSCTKYYLIIIFIMMFAKCRMGENLFDILPCAEWLERVYLLIT